MFSKNTFHSIRYFGSIIAITSILLVFLTSIPGIGSLLGIHEFGLFLSASLVSILLIDIFVIDMIGIIDSKIWRTLFFGLLAMFVVTLLGTIVFSYYQVSNHLLTYVCYGSGVLLFLFSKQRYDRSSLSPNLWGFVSAGSSMIAIFLSACFASYILALGNIQEVNCQKLQEYSSKLFIGSLSSRSGVSLGGSTLAGRFSLSFEELLSKTPERRQQFKTLYIDDVVTERKMLSQNACEVIFSQIASKVQEHKQSIQISLLLLLFFLLWPFVVFFIRGETILAYCILLGLSRLGCYHKKKEQQVREYRI